jgi:hypothetical protein
LQEVIDGGGVRGGFRRLGGQQVQVQFDGDAAGDLILRGEKVIDVALRAVPSQPRKFGVSSALRVVG